MTPAERSNIVRSASREVSAAGLAILGVVAASAALVPADPLVVVLVAGLCAGLGLTGGVEWRRAGRLMLRLKWFYLSLAVFYGLWPAQTGDAFQGLQEAGWRIVALMLVVVLVVWLTGRFSRSALVGALGALLGGPRQVLGGWGESFARRLFLALALFEDEKASVEQRRAGLRGSRGARLLAVREWLVERLDQALAGGAELQPEAWKADAGDAEGGVPWWGLAWLWAGVMLVWAALLGGWIE